METANILDNNPASIMPATPTPSPITEVNESTLRKFGDIKSTRQGVYDNVYNTLSNLEPVTNKTHTLRLANVKWQDPDKFTKRQRKEAQLTGRTLARRLRGTWELLDNGSGEVIDAREQVVLRVPHLTDSGTFVHNGNEYAIKNQQRLRAGVYSRKKDNGEIESHANVLKGGSSHRYFMDPAKGVFYGKFGGAKIPLLPLLGVMGASEKEIRNAWGSEVYAANYSKKDGGALKKLATKLLSQKILDEHDGKIPAALRAKFEGMEIDPEVSEHTLGRNFSRLDKDAMLAATSKLLKISRGEAETDDRDQLAYQTFHGIEDILSERIAKDRAGVRRQLLFKMAGKRSLKGMPSSALQRQLESAILESGLGLSLEQINPAEVLDKQSQISRLGEGGIPSVQAVPDEARNVQSSHLGFMDPIRTPESFRSGVDVHLAYNSRKGKDGRLYAQFTDQKTGKLVWRNPQQLKKMTVAFPGSMQPRKAHVPEGMTEAAVAAYRRMYAGRPSPQDEELLKAYAKQIVKPTTSRVPAMRDGKMAYVKRGDVDVVLPHMEQAFSPLGNLIPLKSMVKGQRVAMSSRMTTQALPVVNAEAPLVQSGIPGSDDDSFENKYGTHMGAVRADQGGRVVAVEGENIHVQYEDGSTDTVELYQNHPHNRKTAIHQTATVQPGQVFKSGDLLARSNYTDGEGVTALGLNARVAYLPWQGKNFEDAIVISEGMAKRLTSEHMYRHELDVTPRTEIGKKMFMQQFAGKYDKKTLENFDDNGAIKIGTEVNYGDPLLLAVEQRSRAKNKITKRGQPGYADKSQTWKHNDPGVVTDVVQGKKGPVVLVKSMQEMRVGDKLSGRYGGKGVVSDIIPDSQMPSGADGKAFEILLNPLGVISRTNPSQVPEAALGKLARKLGKAIKVQDFDDVEDRTKWVLDQLQAHGINMTEAVNDPHTGNSIPDILTGERFFMKLHHQAEGKGAGRGGGGYTQDDTPARGGDGGSKRMGMLDLNALLSHGATEVVRDSSAVRGQKNEDYWLQFMQGHNPKAPKVPRVYSKFVAQLKGAGINVVREGRKSNIMAMTNKDVDKLAGDRIITSGETVRFDKDLKPIEGGLFDPKLTGGHNGGRWAKIKLPTPMPNPVMEEPIRRMLDMTKQQYRDTLAGKHTIKNHGTGPQAINKAVESLNVDKEIAVARAHIAGHNKGKRDTAVRKLGYLKSAKQMKLEPKDWMLKSVPVLPPEFRPISVMGEKELPLISDANYLYKELLDANTNYDKLKEVVGEDGIGNESLAIYDAFKGITGLADPVTEKNQEKNVKGLLKGIFGTSPKLGTMQRKLLGATVDNVGRAVITPNPDFDMDTIGVPEDKAFEVYNRFIIRRLRRKGMPMVKAMEQVKSKSKLARAMLLEEMEDRPIISNRAPVLHRFGIMAFKPKLVKGSTLQISPLVVKGFNADFDGDALNYHVPATEEARKEALEKMLPSRRLINPSDFKSPVHVPGQEYVGGLFQSSGGHGHSDKAVRTFRNRKDVILAYKQGKVGIKDRIKILE